MSIDAPPRATPLYEANDASNVGLDIFNIPDSPEGLPEQPKVTAEAPAPDLDNSESLISPEQQEHDMMVDREILGRSRSLAASINEGWSRVKSGLDELRTSVSSGMVAGERSVHQWIRNRNQNSLVRKKTRHDNRHAAYADKIERKRDKAIANREEKRSQSQADIDGIASDRLRELRQQRHDSRFNDASDEALHRKYNDKQIAYTERSSFKRRAERIDELQGFVHSNDESIRAADDEIRDNTDALQQRQAERQQGAETYRDTLLKNREAALARKHLRRELRGQGARRSEVREVIAGMESEDGGVAMSLLGRAIGEHSLTQKATKRAETGLLSAQESHGGNQELVGRAERHRSDLEDEIKSLEAERRRLNESIEAAQYVIEHSDDAELQHIDFEAAEEGLTKSSHRLVDVEASVRRARRELATLPGVIDQLRAAAASSRESVEGHERAVSSRRGSMGAAAQRLANLTKDIL